MIAPSVPSLPQRIFIKLPGSRRQRSNAYPGQRLTRPAGNFSSINRELNCTRSSTRSRWMRKRIAVGGKLREFSPGEHHIQPHEVVRRGSINHRVRAAGIVRNHPTDGCARTGGHVRPETKSVGIQKPIELIEHHARCRRARCGFANRYRRFVCCNARSRSPTLRRSRRPRAPCPRRAE